MTAKSRLLRLPLWAVVALLCVGGIVVIAGHTYTNQRDTVEATARVVLTATRAPERPSQQFNPAPILLLTRSIESYSSLVTSENFMRRVIDTHNLDTTPAQLRQALSVTSPPDTTVMNFTVRGDSSQETMAAAEAIGIEFTRALADLESPTPIGSVVLGPVQAVHTFPNTFLRTTVLATLASVTAVCVAAILGRSALRRPQPSDSRTHVHRFHATGGIQ